MELFGSLFAILAILTLLFLVIGFLSHSLGWDEAEEKEPTRKSDTGNALAFFVIGLAWGWQTWSGYSSGEPSLLMLAVSGFSAIGSIYFGTLFALRARRRV